MSVGHIRDREGVDEFGCKERDGKKIYCAGSYGELNEKIEIKF
jgi:hypothetical protein